MIDGSASAGVVKSQRQGPFAGWYQKNLGQSRKTGVILSAKLDKATPALVALRLHLGTERCEPVASGIEIGTPKSPSA